MQSASQIVRQTQGRWLTSTTSNLSSRSTQTFRKRCAVGQLNLYFSLLRSYRQGVSFCDISPVFRSPLAFEALVTHLVHRLVSDTIPTSPNKRIDVVIGLEARGFLLGPVIALRLGAAFVPVRKRGKLPGECVHATYEKEYGSVRHVYYTRFSFRLSCGRCIERHGAPLPPPSPKLGSSCSVVANIFFFGGGVDHHPGQDEFEMQADAITPGQTVVIVDDILATGAPCLPDRMSVC